MFYSGDSTAAGTSGGSTLIKQAQVQVCLWWLEIKHCCVFTFKGSMEIYNVRKRVMYQQSPRMRICSSWLTLAMKTPKIKWDQTQNAVINIFGINVWHLLMRGTCLQTNVWVVWFLQGGLIWPTGVTAVHCLVAPANLEPCTTQCCTSVKHHSSYSFVRNAFFYQFATKSCALQVAFNDVVQSFLLGSPVCLAGKALGTTTPKHYKVQRVTKFCSRTLSRAPEETPATSQSTIPDTRRGLAPSRWGRGQPLAY